MLVVLIQAVILFLSTNPLLFLFDNHFGNSSPKLLTFRSSRHGNTSTVANVLFDNLPSDLQKGLEIALFWLQFNTDIVQYFDSVNLYKDQDDVNTNSFLDIRESLNLGEDSVLDRNDPPEVTSMVDQSNNVNARVRESELLDMFVRSVVISLVVYKTIEHVSLEESVINDVESGSQVVNKPKVPRIKLPHGKNRRTIESRLKWVCW